MHDTTTMLSMLQCVDDCKYILERRRGRGGGMGEKNMYGMRHQLSQFIHYPRLPSHL
jgi:hypothetical protein